MTLNKVNLRNLDPRKKTPGNNFDPTFTGGPNQGVFNPNPGANTFSPSSSNFVLPDNPVINNGPGGNVFTPSGSNFNLPVQTPQDDPFNANSLFNNLNQGGQFDQGNILTNVNPQIGQGIESNIQGLLSGSAFDAQQSLDDEAFARQAGHLKAQAGGFNVGNLGQGSAITAQQGTDQAILSAIAEKNLKSAVEREKLKMQGTQLGMNLAGQNQAATQFNQQLGFNYANMASNEKLAADANWLTQQGIDQNKAKLFGYTDANGNKIMGTIEQGALAFEQAMNSQAGQGFSSYIMTNKDADINDPAVRSLGQKLWESLGNKGQAPDSWIEDRVNAVRDPSLTNPIIAMGTMLDEAVAAGEITQEEADAYKTLFNDILLNPEGYKQNPDGSWSKNGEGEGEDALTPKQEYDEFMTLHAHKEYKDLTQAQWEAAGKPKTWDDYIKNNPYNKAGDLIGDDGEVKADNRLLQKIYKGIQDEDPIAMENYAGDEKLGKYIDGFWKDNPMTEESAQAFIDGNMGKIVETENGPILITGGKLKSLTGEYTVASVSGYNIQTGEPIGTLFFANVAS